MAALADPVRLRILAELKDREISPSDFASATGVELDYVSRCFRQLSDWGYVEVAEERRAHRGGAAVQRIYRGAEPPVFAATTPHRSPPLDRAASHPVLGKLFRLAAEAVETGAYSTEPDSVLVYDTRALEEEAWAELVRLLDEFIRGLPELQGDAEERLRQGSSEPMIVVVGVAAFRAPRSPFLSTQVPELLLDAQASGGPDKSADSLSMPTAAPEIVMALSNRWRSRILMELTLRPMSPSRFVEEIGGDPSYIARSFRELAASGIVEIAEERKGGRRGGGVERVYRNVRHPYTDDASWQILPRPLLREMQAALLTTFMAQAGEAIEAGALDTPGGRHLTCSRLVLDRPAWERIRIQLGGINERLASLAEDSLTRNGSAVEGLTPALAGLLSFRLPDSPRRPLPFPL